ncbi:MAG TPA: phage tail tape measure protein, partial [Candidatus Paceibacterota bacterium]
AGVDNVNEVLARAKDTVKTFFAKLASGFDGIKNINLEPLKNFLKNLTFKFEPLEKVGGLLGKVLTLLVTLVKKIAPIALRLGSIVADGVGTFLDKITTSLENFEPERVFDIINGGLLAGVLLAIRNFVNKGSGMFDGVKGVLDGVKGSLEAWQSSLKADVLLKIAAALGIMTLSIIAISMIDSKKLTAALGAITIMFAQLGLSLAGFQKISSSVNPMQMATMATGLLAVASALLIMSLALSVVAKLSGKQLIKGTLALGVLVGVVKIAADSLSKSSGKMILGAIALNIFAVALIGLTLAVRSLGDIDTEALTKGLIGVGVLMTELAVFMKVTDLGGMGILKAAGILVLAAAVNLLAFAVGQMAKMDVQALTRGLTAIGVVLTELGLFVTVVGAAPTLVLTAGGILVIAASMLILANVLEQIGKLSWEEIAKGLTAIAIALTLIGAAGYLIPPTLVLQAAGLVVMAAALVILAKALQTMGSMTWDEIARGLVVLAGSLLILTVALTAMSGTLVGSAALLVAAAALMAIAPALKILGGMSWEEVGRGLLTLAGVFLVLGLAGALLTPV